MSATHVQAFKAAHIDQRKLSNGAVSKPLEGKAMTTESPALTESPPAQIVHSLNPVKLFQEFERDGFFLRDPAANTAGLYRTMAVGDCLEPILTAGDGLLIEMGATPQHGDICMFQWSESVLKSWETDPRRAEWIAKFGHTDFSRGMKLFWRFPQGIPAQFQDDYLIANDGMRKVDGNTILGVLRGVERGGQWLTGDIVHRPVGLASIDPNAATTVAEVSVSGVVVPSSNLGVLTVIASLTVGPFPFATTVVMTATGTWTEPGSSAGSAIEYSINTSTTVLGPNLVTIQPTSANQQGLLAVESTFALAANTTTTYNLLGISAPGTGINSFTVTQATMKAEVIKR